MKKYKSKESVVTPPRTHLIKWRVSYLNNKVPAFCVIEAASHRQAIKELSKQPGVKILRVRSTKTAEQIMVRSAVRNFKRYYESKQKQVSDVTVKLRHTDESAPEHAKLTSLLSTLEEDLSRAYQQLFEAQTLKKNLAGSQLVPPQAVE